MTSKVCVIGAGAAGLCAARHLLAATPGVTPVVFEQSGVLGGTWVYTDEVGRDGRHGLPIHSSMYKNLRTNLPKEVMAFPDFPFDDSECGKRSFIGHDEVRQYLERYTDHFDIRPCIKFEKRVKHVAPAENGGWRVSVVDLGTEEVTSDLFRAVLVCNGHYSIPAFAEVANLKEFRGKVMHSHDYRANSEFRGKKVAVLGAAASGQDIGLEIAQAAAKVFICHNNPTMTSPLPSNVEQCKGIVSCVGSNAFTLSDGAAIDAVDAVVFCTGYEYDMSFMSEEVPLRLADRQIQPLYKHLVHTRYPTLAVIGVPIKIVPFPFFDVQVRYFCSHLAGNFALPPDMDAYTAAEKARRRAEEGVEEKHFHKFGGYQWGYLRDLAEESGVTPLPKQFEDLYELVWNRRRKNLVGYKNDNFEWSAENGRYVDRL